MPHELNANLFKAFLGLSLISLFVSLMPAQVPTGTIQVLFRTLPAPWRLT
jgi:hypothetical protein